MYIQRILFIILLFFSMCVKLLAQYIHIPNHTLELVTEKNNINNNVLNNDAFRHEAIIKLDNLVNKQYNWWLDFDTFEIYFNTIHKQETKPEIDYLKKVTGDSVYDDFVHNLNKEKWEKYKDALFFKRWDALFIWLQLDSNIYNQSVVEANVSFLDNHKTVQYLCYYYQEQINQSKYNHVANSIKERNHKILRKHLALIEDREFVHYKSEMATRKAFKEINFFMDNDIFIPGNLTTDHEYTGGGKITVSTDYLSLKWLYIGWINDIGKDDTQKVPKNILSYQSVSFGLTAFTPYIRYRNNYELADTLFQYDRPFGSYMYIDISKYRLWPKGLIRHSSSFQLGIIGSNAGRWMQETFHKVYGWEKQIANGGHLLIQLNHTTDFLLFSSTNKYCSVFNPSKKNLQTKNFGLNFYSTGEILWGGYLTSLGGGITLSSSDFIKQSGQRTINPFKNNKFKFGILLNATVKYRYIVHNSMLEGSGYWTTYVNDIIDDDDGMVYTLNLDYYKSQNEQINEHLRRYERTPKEIDEVERNMFIFDTGLNLRFRKMVIYYQLNFFRKEYKNKPIDFNSLIPLVNIEQQEYYIETIVPEFEKYYSRSFYGYGRIGVVWLLGE